MLSGVMAAGTGCSGGVCNTVYVSPQLNSGGNITASWSTGSTSFNVARNGLTAITYANNIYVLGGYDGSNYLSDVQFAQISTSDGSVQAAGITVPACLPRSDNLPVLPSTAICICSADAPMIIRAPARHL